MKLLKGLLAGAVLATTLVGGVSSNDISKLGDKTPTVAQAKTVKTVKLASTIDGDTAKFKIDGKVYTVRFLLVDTPETKHPQLGVQPYGKEASNYVSNKLKKAKKIQLDFDKNGLQGDKYGRKLAYVYVDGKDLNLDIVSKGYARVAYAYSPNLTNHNKYLKAQKKAKAKKLNIWSKKGYVTDSGFNSKGKEDTTSTEPSDTVVGNKNDFKNCTELRKVYPNGVKKGHPAYKASMDRDKDNVACEK